MAIDMRNKIMDWTKNDPPGENQMPIDWSKRIETVDGTSAKLLDKKFKLWLPDQEPQSCFLVKIDVAQVSGDILFFYDKEGNPVQHYSLDGINYPLLRNSSNITWEDDSID